MRDGNIFHVISRYSFPYYEFPTFLVGGRSAYVFCTVFVWALISRAVFCFWVVKHIFLGFLALLRFFYLGAGR